jgi:hypothetical protein
VQGIGTTQYTGSSAEQLTGYVILKHAFRTTKIKSELERDRIKYGVAFFMPCNLITTIISLGRSSF